MTMQPDLPWNVAGIAPEARDAARASARREGLSVGEWLTRRILRGLPEIDAQTDAWSFAKPEPPLAFRETGRAVRETIQAPARDTYGRRENGNGGESTWVATRDDRADTALVNRIVHLEARIAKIERLGTAASTKQTEAVKNLQQRIEELSERVTLTASRSAAHSTELAKTVEALAGKFSQTRVDAERHNAMANEVSAVAENVGVLSEKIEEAHAQGERQFRVVDGRVASIETALDAIRRDRETVVRLDGSFDTLTRRLDSTEAEYLNNIEQLESRLTRIEADSGDSMIDRRLQGIEQALADMAALIAKNTTEKVAAAESSEQPAARTPHEKSVEAGSTAAPVPPFGTEARPPILDVPPFPERSENRPATLPGDLRAASPLTDHHASGQDGSAKRPLSPEVESFLSAARRNIGAGNAPQPQRTTAFSWVEPAVQKTANAGVPTRLALLVGLSLVVLAAIGTGLYLRANAVSPSAPPQKTMLSTVTAPVKANSQVPISVQRTLPAPSVIGAAAKPVPHVATQTPSTASTAIPPSRPASAPVRLHPPPAGPRPPQPTVVSKPLTPQQRLAALAGTGNAKAEEVLGLEYVDGDGVTMNEAEGAKWLERAASRGEAVAAWRLGTMYEHGHGVTADQAKASQWYAIAAKAGNRKAMHNLAVAYTQGTGVQKDFSLAAQWFLRAANLGLADSQFNLAVLYERGMGVQQSLTEAYKWYAIAAAQGDTESKSRMDALSSQISADDKAAADKAVAAFQPAPLDRSANAPPIAASLIGG